MESLRPNEDIVEYQFRNTKIKYLQEWKSTIMLSSELLNNKELLRNKCRNAINIYFEKGNDTVEIVNALFINGVQNL